MNIAIADYDPDNPNDVPDIDDPTALTEEVDRAFMNKLAKTITRLEEVLNVGQADLSINDIGVFLDARGNALDMLDDPQLAEWLDKMRQVSRCPFRRFSVRG